MLENNEVSKIPTKETKLNRCDACGAPMKGSTCAYCGVETSQELDNDVAKIFKSIKQTFQEKQFGRDEGYRGIYAEAVMAATLGKVKTFFHDIGENKGFHAYEYQLTPDEILLYLRSVEAYFEDPLKSMSLADYENSLDPTGDLESLFCGGEEDRYTLIES